MITDSPDPTLNIELPESVVLVVHIRIIFWAHPWTTVLCKASTAAVATVYGDTKIKLALPDGSCSVCLKRSLRENRRIVFVEW